MFPASDPFVCSPLPSNGSRGRHILRGPAVPHLHRYYGLIRFPQPITCGLWLPSTAGYLSAVGGGDWEAFPSSWRIPLKACRGLETPAAPDDLA